MHEPPQPRTGARILPAGSSPCAMAGSCSTATPPASTTTPRRSFSNSLRKIRSVEGDQARTKSRSAPPPHPRDRSRRPDRVLPPEIKPSELLPGEGYGQSFAQFFLAAFTPALDGDNARIALTASLTTLRFAALATAISVVAGFVLGFLGSTAWWPPGARRNPARIALFWQPVS